MKETMKLLSLFLLVSLLSSCGTTKSTTEVVNSADGTQITISQSTSGGTVTVDVKPSVSVDSTKVL